MRILIVKTNNFYDDDEKKLCTAKPMSALWDAMYKSTNLFYLQRFLCHMKLVYFSYQIHLIYTYLVKYNVYLSFVNPLSFFSNQIDLVLLQIDFRFQLNEMDCCLTHFTMLYTKSFGFVNCCEFI